MDFANLFSGSKRIRSLSSIVPLRLEDDRLLIYSACDSEYFKYAQALARSIDLFSPGFSLLLHVVNPTEEVRNAAVRLASSLKNTRLAVTAESIDLTNWSSDERRTYYACARFPGISRLLKEYQATPVLCLDADSLVVNPVDGDFTDKVDADVVVDLRGKTHEHLAVAAGAIWFRPASQVRKFAFDMAEEVDRLVRNRELKWFADQTAFYRQMQAHGRSARFFNLKRKYLDWDFGEDSIVWSAKGKRKDSDLRFLALYLFLAGDAQQAQVASQLLAGLAETGSSLTTSSWFMDRIERARRGPARVALFVPRLDLPWKRPQGDGRPPALNEDVLGLRLRWQEFASRMANALEREGVTVDLLQIPAADIDAARLDATGADMALIPHRCHLDWTPGKTRVLFYMQEYFRWVFVVNARGWSAAADVYPIDVNTLPDKASNAFQTYRDKLLNGQWSSKFDQAPQKTTAELIAAGALPARTGRDGQPEGLPFIFFPLQIPHDQSIRYFSPVEEIDVVKALVAWARSRKVAIVMKPHPANREAMEQFHEFVDDSDIFWSEANINDLIRHAAAVYTINSGVGFEALLHVKPVVTFGRVEYDCVTFHATLDNLDAAWSHCCSREAASLEDRYSRFVNWFLDDYAVDMSRPEHAATRLAEIAQTIGISARGDQPGGS